MFDRGLTALLAIIGCVCALGGCAEMRAHAPEPPRWRFETVPELVARLPSSTTSNWHGPPAKLAQCHVGLLEYTGGAGAGAATHETAMQMAALEAKKALTVVDRTRLQEVEAELKLTNERYMQMSEEDRVKSVGGLVKADYFLVGNVGEFGSSTQSVTLRAVFLPGELERYRQDYAKFKTDLDADRKALDSVSEVLTPTVVSNTEAKRARLEALDRETKSPQAWQDEIATRSSSETVQFSKVTMNGRLIDLKTGRAVWFFNGETTGIGSTDTMRFLVGKLLAELTKGSDA